MDRFSTIFHSFCISILLVMFVCFRGCSGHGILLEPPGRSSLWRFRGLFPNAPTNYDDNGLNCGGRSYQHETVGGKCGVCGDKWGDGIPRPNEAGGKYANGVIARRYKRHDVINVTIQVTASHKGYFEFRICPVNNKNTAATHTCLNRHLLRLDTGADRFYYGQTSGMYYMKVQLPANLTCTQCVFQWRWRTGNSWGTEPSGRGCVGCGHQEEFYGCSDISIDDDGDSGESPEVDSPEGDSPAESPEGDAGESPEIPEGNDGVGGATHSPKITEGTTAAVKSEEQTTLPHVTRVPTSTTARSTDRVSTRPTVNSTGKSYEPVGIWKTVPGMGGWCNNNCVRGYCPRQFCAVKGRAPDVSKPQCKAANVWLGNPGMDKWCQNNCAGGYCPESHCSCI